MDRAFSFVAGKNYLKVYKITDVFGDNGCIKPNTWYESEFFRFKCFKKGSIHIEVKDLFLLKKFNVEVAAGRNWLPADYGHSTTQ